MCSSACEWQHSRAWVVVHLEGGTAVHAWMAVHAKGGTDMHAWMAMHVKDVSKYSLSTQ